MAEEIRGYQNAVDVIKTAILQSQARAAKAVNQEQLALYYGIGRYMSANSRKKNWGKGAIETLDKMFVVTNEITNINPISSVTTYKFVGLPSTYGRCHL